MIPSDKETKIKFNKIFRIGKVQLNNSIYCALINIYTREAYGSFGKINSMLNVIEWMHISPWMMRSLITMEYIPEVVEMLNKKYKNIDEENEQDYMDAERTKKERDMLLHSIINELQNKGFENFVHMTHVSNLVSIFKSGYLKCRKNASMFYDNMERNSTTKNVMSTNKSKQIEKYARLYLRPVNATLYAMYNNQFAVLEFSPDMVYELQDEGRLIFKWGSAHYMEDCEFDTKKVNTTETLKDFLEHKDRYDEIFKTLLDNKDNGGKWKNIMNSELLIYDKVSTKYITKIVFLDEEIKKEFIDTIKKESLKDSDDIINKCTVDWRYFMN